MIITAGVAYVYWPVSSSLDPSLQLKITELKKRYERPDSILYPESNPYTLEKHDLGKMLFFDNRLSGDNTMACASCHNPSLSWSDGLGLAKGHQGKILARRTPTILNVAWGWSFFWDGRAKTLEEQALGPIQSPDEMNQDLPGLIKELSALPGYVEAFEKAFPGEGINDKTISRSIATYERSVVSGLSPFDYWIAGDERAISDEAKKGFLVFNQAGACVKCHTGWRFTNESFADTGLSGSDEGRGKVVGNPVLSFVFKTPTLRNVAKRGPFMHDGSIASLKEVVEMYSKGAPVKRELAMAFTPILNLTSEQQQNLVRFLETLTSEDEAVSAPKLPMEATGRTSWENNTLSSRH